MKEEHRKNLEKLAAHLEKRPSILRRYRIRFSMKNWAKNPKFSEFLEIPPKVLVGMSREFTGACGTVVCAMGEASLIFPEAAIATRYGWLSLGEDLFGLKDNSSEWKWIFSASWFSVDNSRIGAAKRIRWFLKNGLPENWLQQMSGKLPLCYK